MKELLLILFWTAKEIAGYFLNGLSWATAFGAIVLSVEGQYAPAGFFIGVAIFTRLVADDWIFDAKEKREAE